MMLGYAYLVALVSAILFVGRFGELFERWALAVFVVGSSATWIVLLQEDQMWDGLQLNVLLIDAAALLSFAFIALRSRRFWPLWITAFQLIVVVAHVAKYFYPGVLSPAYAIGESIWSLLQVVLLTAAVADIKRLHSDGLTESFMAS
jgi:uncharacterized membrane protein (UPF0136 family)